MIKTFQDLVSDFQTLLNLADARNERLEEITDDYLNRIGDFNCPKGRTSQYIQKLLPLELAFAHWRNVQFGECCLPNTKPVDCLVMLVGFAFDPLLQSIAVYQPKTILLVLSRKYNKDGQAHGEDFKGYLRALKDLEYPECVTQTPEIKNALPAASGARILNETPRFLEPDDLDRTVGNRPVDVFRWLQRVLSTKRGCFADQLVAAGVELEGGKPNVILDITGAKKSMVAGAYVYAASSNTTVSYVDFDKYHERAGQPYGFACRIVQLTNPIELFRVRDWRRVVTLYKNYQFDAARELLSEIKATKITQTDRGDASDEDEGLLFAPEQEAFTKVEAALQMLHMWENGDFHGANTKHGELIAQYVDPPAAVSALHDRWPDEATMNDPGKLVEHTTTWSGGPESLYLDNRLLLHYAYDEREKIRRLIKLKEDFRSAFLRAHGLSETLVKARLLRRWYCNQLRMGLGTGKETEWKVRQELVDDARGKAEETEASLMHLPSPVIVGTLLRGSSCQVDVNHGGERVRAKFKLVPDTPKMDAFYEEDRAFWVEKQFYELRNSAIHFCLSFSESLANRAFTMLQKNLDEFTRNWLDIVPRESAATITTEDAKDIENAVTNSRPTWSDLSEACGLTLLPDLDAIQSTRIETTEDCGGGTEKAGDQAGNQNDGDKHDTADSPTVEVAP